LRAAFHSAHGQHLRATYGLTEAPTVVSIDPVGEQWQPAASGRVLPHLQVVAHDEAGAALAAGADGELRLAAADSGPWAGAWTPMLGYWEDGAVRPSAAPTLTGDVGSVDAGGWLTIVGRKKVVVIRGGANVYPAEVERVLTACPDVAAAAVFGVPDERLGERVAALVEPVGSHVDLDELRAVCASQLARYKVPEIWAAVPHLPTNAMGKVVRTDLGELLEAARS
jgi:long-chain acyl-CoA synthetase